MIKIYYIVIGIIILLNCTNAVSFDADSIKNTHERLSHKRKMSTCSRIEQCDEGSKEDICTWMNSQGINNPDISIVDEKFTQETDYVFCDGMPQYDIIDLAYYDSLTLTHSSLADSKTNILCKWTVLADSSKPTELEVHRGFGQAEDIVISLVNGDKSSMYITSRDLSSCETGKINGEHQNIEKLVIYAKMISSESKYTITLKQHREQSRHPNEWIFAILLPLISGIVLILTFTFIFFFARSHCLKYLKDLRLRKLYNIYLKEQAETLEKRIQLTFDAMQKAEFKLVQAKYNQDSGIIGLEEFKPEDEVNVTNEGSHVFHSKGLFEWFENMPISKELACPHCSTITLPIASTNFDNKVSIVPISNDVERLLVEARGTSNIINQIENSIAGEEEAS